MKGQSVLFSKKSDEWSTPQWLFDELNAEFNFQIDLAAKYENKKCHRYIGERHYPEDVYTEVPPVIGSLSFEWNRLSKLCKEDGGSPWLWCNPPYSQCKEFVRHAHNQMILGAKVVMLLPARVDTQWFHYYVYRRPGVEIRFLRGRLKFGDSKNSAPFPSMVVVFRGTQ